MHFPRRKKDKLCLQNFNKDMHFIKNLPLAQILWASPDKTPKTNKFLFEIGRIE